MHTRRASYTTSALLVSAASVVFIAVAPAFAQVIATQKQTSFTDVPAGAWYESSVKALVDLGAVDTSEATLRPNDMATRADVVQLLVKLYNRDLQYPAVASFNDVTKQSTNFPYFEAAARAGWVHGDNDCYGTKPCYARPYGYLNRAEAAALLVRSFALPSSGTAPTFFDNSDRSQWYYQPIQTAADHCILQGDDFTHLVRPASTMNRAEMMVMLYRTYQNLNYSQDCSPTSSSPTADISTAVALSSDRVRLTFNTDLQSSIADDSTRYTVRAVNGANYDVTAATVVSNRIIDLTLSGNIDNSHTYVVNANGLRTTDGRNFSAEQTFSFSATTPRILDVSTLANNLVRVRFDTDLNTSAANDAFRYLIRDVSGGTDIGVKSSSVIDARTVELTLNSNLQANRQYQLNATDLTSSSGVQFSGNNTFTWNQLMPNTNTVTFVSPTVLRVTSNVDLDPTFATDKSRWLVSSNGSSIAVTNAQLISNRVVELTLATPVENQRSYTVTASNVMTSGGVGFTSSGSTVYSGTGVNLHANLLGTSQVPAVATVSTGSGTFTLTSNGLQYDITVHMASGSTISAAHFHRGAAGVNGPVIQPITFIGNRATGTWTNLTDQDRNDLLSGNIYVNVHTPLHPDGEIRGQVLR